MFEFRKLCITTAITSAVYQQKYYRKPSQLEETK